MSILTAINAYGRGSNHFAGGDALLDCGEAALQMQRARASVVVETIRGIGLLLRLHHDGARSQRVHGASCYIDHLALIHVDPIEQFFRMLFIDSLLELSACDAG